MTTISNGESGLSVRNKINNVFQHADGSASELVINEAGADVNFRVESDTNANALFVDGSTGNVGIGTSSPNAKMAFGEASDIAFNTNLGSTGTYASIKSFNVLVPTNPATNIRFIRDVALFGNDGAICFDTTNAERMRIDSSGNVGIGTSSPEDRLDLGNGNLRFKASLGGTGTYGSIKAFNTAAPTNPATNIRFIRDVSSFGNDGAICFDTVNTERLRIDSSGNLLVGTTTSGGEGVTVSGAFGQIRQHSPGTSAAQITQFIKNGTQVGNITVTTTATAYNITSDYRLKEDVQPMVGASDRVLSLNPVNFAWKADGSRTDGFIAHEVQEVAPYAVTGEKDGEEMQAMDHSKLVPLLTAALQEALTKIEALEARITALEA